MERGDSRHYLCVVDEVLQGIAAGEVIVQVCGVTDDALGRARRVDEACDDHRLDFGEGAEHCRCWGLVHNLPSQAGNSTGNTDIQIHKHTPTLTQRSMVVQ